MLILNMENRGAYYQSETINLLPIKEHVISHEGQNEVVGFIDNLRKELGSNENYENICKLGDIELEQDPFTNEKFQFIFDRFEEYINETPPGHDPGHLYRDLVTSVILFENESKNSYSTSDALAGLLGGCFHDIGTSIIPRYQDKKYGAGHAEAGAYLFWGLSEGVLGENTRKLVSYSIAAHTNYLKSNQVQIPPGYMKEPYWDATWESEGKLLGVGPQLTRRSDRLDTNGVTLLMRHIISRFDSVEEGGQDLYGDQWCDINRESLMQVMNPVIRENISNPPTTLEHVLQFARSNDGNNPYSDRDYLFPKFKELMNFKVNQINGLINAINHPFIADLENNDSLEKIHQLFSFISKSDSNRFNLAWDNFESVWHELTDDQKQRWVSGFSFIEGAYIGLINFYKLQSSESQFKPILNKAFGILEKYT